MRRLPALLAMLAFSLAVTPAGAEPMQQVAQAYLIPYIGNFDTFDKKDYAQFGLEFRGDDLYYGLRPMVGANVTDEGDLYGYGGLAWDVSLWRNKLFLTPNFAVGLYDHNGGKDLGGPIEFRSGLEVSYAFDDMSRLGFALNHVSNASIYNSNPGAETLLVNYQFPFN